MQILYAHVPVSKIGSLSYAEDEGKHIIGFKVSDPLKERFVCHVIECDNEVSVCVCVCVCT